MSATIYAERVARGAALLDEKVPGWDRRINLGSLDLGDGDCCIIGQLFPGDGKYLSNYSAGIDALGLFSEEGPPWPVDDHGFDAMGGFAIRMLEAEWRRVIKARRSGEQS